MIFIVDFLKPFLNFQVWIDIFCFCFCFFLMQNITWPEIQHTRTWHRGVIQNQKLGQQTRRLRNGDHSITISFTAKPIPYLFIFAQNPFPQTLPFLHSPSHRTRNTSLWFGPIPTRTGSIRRRLREPHERIPSPLPKRNRKKSGAAKDPKIQEGVNRVECLSSAGASEGTGFGWVEGGFRVQPLQRTAKRSDCGSGSNGVVAGGDCNREGRNKLPQSTYSSDSDLFCGCGFGFVCEIWEGEDQRLASVFY